MGEDKAKLPSMYVELHASSAFSFLRASSLPEALVDRAAELGYPALALLDRDGVPGAPRFFKAARAAGIRPLVGAELSLADGGSLGVLVESQEGYRHLCEVVTRMKSGVAKGAARLDPDSLGRPERGFGHEVGGLVAVVGADTLGRRPDPSRLAPILRAFGAASVVVEVQRHRRRDQEAANQALLDLAAAHHLPAVATGGVRHARAGGRALLDVLTCIREKRTLATAGRLLSDNSERYLKSPKAMAALFGDRPDVLRNTEALADRLQFTLQDLGYRFPKYPVEAGETELGLLRKLAEEGARRRYQPYHERARRQVERELELIARLDLAGYFLIVWDIVQFCRRNDVLVQGRGSAANSAVCYSLGITAVDPVGMDLLFERFLSEERGEWPDIDLDLPSGDRRESVIQHVYRRYGPRGAAMTANVITYREKSATREIGKVLGIPEEDTGRLSKFMRQFEYVDADDDLHKKLVQAGYDVADRRVRLFASLFAEIQDLPRHLGQHSGGMVVCQGALDAVVPLEPASMPGRTIVQWDKDDCADMGIVKVDLLGLGMMSALQDSIRYLHDVGVEVDLAHLPPDDPKVYSMLREADTVGLFQVESRAQMATLPRMRPERFYDLVVEVAIIRPGPIVGNMVHPYLARRQGHEPVVYAHPSLQPILERTLGVPLFQEQLLRMAMAVAGFTGGEAEELRRAFSAKRSRARMAAVEKKLRDGMTRNGIAGATQDQIVQSIVSFALYGFPESHAASFALIAYASAWLKAHHGAAFLCGLLNNQPMGFYRPLTLVKDAQRHGVHFKPIDATVSDWDCTLERVDDGGGKVSASEAVVFAQRPVLGDDAAQTRPSERGHGGESPRVDEGKPASQQAKPAGPQARPTADSHAVRLGLRYVAGLRKAAGERIVAERRAAPYRSLQDLVDRARVHHDELSALAEAGALNAFGLTRRAALWQVERAARPRGALFAADVADDAAPSPLRDMTLGERLDTDLRRTGLSVGPHPMALHRRGLAVRGIRRAVDLTRFAEGDRVTVAGAVICRQRPGTAKGFVFLTLEDETGLSNIIVRPDLYARRTDVLLRAPLLEVDGVLQLNGAVTLRAIEVRPLELAVETPASRDFH
jgi:error-prone DNA polymerase